MLSLPLPPESSREPEAALQDCLKCYFSSPLEVRTACTSTCQFLMPQCYTGQSAGVVCIIVGGGQKPNCLAHQCVFLLTGVFPNQQLG